MKTWRDIDGWFDYEDLYDAAVRDAVDGDVFVEIGCWLGKSTVYLAKKIIESGKKIELYAIDNFSGVTLPEGETISGICNGLDLLSEFKKNIRESGVEYRVKLIVGDSANSAQRFADKSITFAFIDADHSYEAVKRDIAAWRGKIKPGGVLAGHDRQRLSVAKAVEEAFPKYRAMGPEAWVVKL